MKTIWNKYLALPVLTALLGLAACSNDSVADNFGPTEPAGVKFKLAVGSQEPQPVAKDQLMRLFVGERKPEHGVEELHLLGVLEDVTEGHLTFTKLKPQWYKFAFLCVPRNGNNQPLNLFTEENPGEATCNMNRILLDYMPILAQGAGKEDFEEADTPLPPGDIYRKVLSFWLKKDTMVTKNVVLTRLNGQLDLDMGILVDQFEHRVDRVELELTNLPTRIYITDNDKEEIKTTNPQTVRFWTKPYPQSDVIESKREHHHLLANLLPCKLEGNLNVYTTDDQGNPHNFTYPLSNSSGRTYRIKPNTRTILRFNGISTNYFDVKYAGYDDTSIDVDEDDWDGWQDNPPKPDTGEKPGTGEKPETNPDKPTPDPTPQPEPAPEPEPAPQPTPNS